jgi:hypothetical protein
LELKVKFADVAGTRTRYYDLGEGEPTILIHGGGPGGDELTFHHRILDVKDKKDGAMTLIVQGIRVENGEGYHVADLHQTTVVRN